jgi:lipoate-protein ligase B
MKISNLEKKILKKRLGQLRNYMIVSLRRNRIDDYINMINSRELRMLENVMIRDELAQMLSVRL